MGGCAAGWLGCHLRAGGVAGDVRDPWSANWLPGPGVERVRAALADDGSIAVIGAVDEITLEPGTVREVTIHGAQKDGFIAYFTPPAP